jgi:fibronectin-binding autotransporter adhesin
MATPSHDRMLRRSLALLLAISWISLNTVGPLGASPPGAGAGRSEAPARQDFTSQEDDPAGAGQPAGVDEPPPGHAENDRLLAELRAFDAARNAGPEAVLAFAAAASPEVLAAIQPEVDQAHAAPQPAGAEPLGVVPLIAGIDGACAYATVQAAINAAPNGATVRVVGQVITESIDIDSGNSITITGGYNAACTSLVGGARTTLRAVVAPPGSAVDVSGGSRVILNSLVISGGTGFGAGVDVLSNSHVTLSNTQVNFNAGSSGGGFYVGGGSVVTLTSGSLVYSNTATVGGGAIVYGRLNALDTLSDFSTNTASQDGGNVAVSGGTLYLNNADVVAGTAGNRGGGIFATQGAIITLTNSVFVGESSPCCQGAVDGGGIYANASQVYLLGNTTSVVRNTATNNGGGVYLTNGSYLYSNGSNIGNTVQATNDNVAVLGGGLYVVSSTVEFSGRIINNTASNSGGGLYATTSVITLTNATVGGTGANDPNAIGASGLNGAGMYLINNTRATLSNTVVVSNTLTNPSTGYGGGIYIRAGSVLTATDSRIERHLAPSALDGRGAGLYIYDATVTLRNTQMLSNTTNNLGAGVRMFGASTLNVLAGSIFGNNHALGGVGGAIAATSAADLNISDSTLLSNTASTDGGAILIDSGTLDFTGAWVLRGNSAGGNGGAVAVTGAGDADFDVTAGPGELAQNAAGGNGGALYVANADSVQLHATGGQPLRILTNTAASHGGALFSTSGAFFDTYGRIEARGNGAGGNGGFAYLSGSGTRLWLDDYFTTRPQILASQALNGGAFFLGSGAQLECDGADIGLAGSGNTAAGSGGAIYLSASSLAADNCHFGGNRALAGNGGAIAAFTSTVALDVDLIAVAQGAGGSVERVDSISAPLATGCYAVGQQCSRLDGNRAFSSTVSNGNGGAIFSSGGGLTMNGLYLHRNIAVRGGAVYQEGSGATAWITNTLIYSNTSLLSFGAGIRNAGGAMTITQATLANNVGGAGYSPGAVQSYLSNNIIWGNSVGAFGALTVANCNIDQSGTAGPATDPLFVSPGAGEDYRLQIASPAVDACLTGASVDLDGYPRPNGAAFDMGAYEWAARDLFLPAIMR